jgi:TonB family protein
MRWPLAFFLLASPYLLGQDSAAPLDWRGWLNRGVREYKNARYPDAVDAFQKAVDLNPNEVTPRLYLATAWMSQYIPGAESPENLDIAGKAETEFNQVLHLDPNNSVALKSIASLMYQEAQGKPNMTAKVRKLDEAASWYEKLLVVDPRDREAYYSIAVIDWVKWYPNYMRARADLGMRPEDPGPLTSAAVRARLKKENSAQIEHGISYLEKALQIDPQYSDAMAYMNLFIRERADLVDTPAEYQRDIEVADHWVQRALEARKNTMTLSPEVALSPRAIVGGTTVPPPPPPPPNAQPVNGQAPSRIRIGGNIAQSNLIRKVDPVYPPMAMAARIQGVVKFTVIIAKDGRMGNIQLVSGHPLLVEPARLAVSQWEYRPTLLNGEPVEVLTTVEVNFSLGLAAPQ